MNLYDAGTIAFHYLVLNSLYSALNSKALIKVKIHFSENTPLKNPGPVRVKPQNLTHEI